MRWLHSSGSPAAPANEEGKAFESPQISSEAALRGAEGGASAAPGTVPGQKARQPRREYRSPKIEDLGRLGEMTLGGSPGLGDSGGGFSEQPPGSPLPPMPPMPPFQDS